MQSSAGTIPRNKCLMLVFAQSEAFWSLIVARRGGLRHEGALKLRLQVQFWTTLLSQTHQIHLHLPHRQSGKSQTYCSSHCRQAQGLITVQHI